MVGGMLMVLCVGVGILHGVLRVRELFVMRLVLGVGWLLRMYGLVLFGHLVVQGLVLLGHLVLFGHLVLLGHLIFVSLFVPILSVLVERHLLYVVNSGVSRSVLGPMGDHVRLFAGSLGRVSDWDLFLGMNSWRRLGIDIERLEDGEVVIGLIGGPVRVFFLLCGRRWFARLRVVDHHVVVVVCLVMVLGIGPVHMVLSTDGPSGLLVPGLKVGVPRLVAGIIVLLGSLAVAFHVETAATVQLLLQKVLEELLRLGDRL